MKAAVVNSFNGVFSIEDLEIAAPIGREVFIEVKASGLCHSDLHLAEHDYGVTLPAVYGHEVAGIVKQIGPDVQEFAIGDHVVASLVRYCGHCDNCLSGRTYLCRHPEENLRNAEQPPRLTRSGEAVTPLYGTAGFAEFCLIHEHQLAKVPKELPFAQASVLGCACVTGAGAVINSANVKPGQTVVVFGVGGVGLNVIAGASLCGAGRIVAIDRQPAKEALARKFGATDFVNATQGDTVDAVRALLGDGADHCFEAIGLRITSEQAILMTRRGGCAYMIGIHEPGTSISVSVGKHLIGGQVTLKGVQMGSSNIKRDIPMLAKLYLQGRFNLDDLISREINISEINEAYDELKHGAIVRSVITSF